LPRRKHVSDADSRFETRPVRHPAACQHLRLRLLDRIGRRFRVVTQAVHIGELELTFTRIADPEEVLNQAVEDEALQEKLAGRRLEDQELHLPYWAQLWDSAAALGQFLLKHPPVAWPGGGRGHARPEVLDLGCGMGLSGVVAAAMGSRVTFVDLETPALLLVRLNSLRWRRRVRIRQLNWRSDELGQRFDRILGADILYDRKEWIYLDRFWRRHLAAEGTVNLGEPGRQTGNDFIATWAAENGWNLSLFEESVPARALPVRVLELRPR
jgi:predicted nicotinamide N-methyase